MILEEHKKNFSKNKIRHLEQKSKLRRIAVEKQKTI